MEGGAAALKLLEPFALDLWRSALRRWFAGAKLAQKTFFGELYQLVIVRKESARALP